MQETAETEKQNDLKKVHVFLFTAVNRPNRKGRDENNRGVPHNYYVWKAVLLSRH